MLNNYFRSPVGKGFLWGAGTALLGVILLPTAKQGIRPVIKKTIQGGLLLSEQVQEAVANAREGLQDLVAEAQFQHLQDSMNKETE